MDDLNGTIDPACLADPPLAMDVFHQLDLFGIALYSILTCLASVSLLLYLEQCVYVYKNVSHPKNTTIIWVSGAAPVIATMSCLGMWIPKSTMITDMTSNSYFAVVIYKCLILMLEECGGDEAFLKYSANKTFKISTGPCCCCCLCLPRVPITRRMLFLLKLGSLQYAIMKTVLSVFSVVLWTNGIFNPSDLEITGAVIWINPFIGVLTLTSLWPVGIMFMYIKNSLSTVKFIPKYAMYQLVLILSQLQSAIINILSLNGTIACSPPFSSAARGSMISQQLMIVEMFVITVFTWTLYRRSYDPVKLESCESENNINVKLSLKHNLDEEHVV
ncbi:organic solute transporter subunit alpha-like [Clarias gariepinus]|uniref:organic solute transporter subunit alpha-like n=1 Tax=Clarias gariepinus TaxID=13013 RepID=UPI00234E295B|nr:organic solute transporter subunit alpha-like [Clarias gariepinus]